MWSRFVHRFISLWIRYCPIFLPYWAEAKGWRIYPSMPNIRSNFEYWSVTLCPHRVEIRYSRINEVIDWATENADDLWCLANRTIEEAYQYPHVSWPSGLGARARGLDESVTARFFFRNKDTAFLCKMMFG
ncbi:MAG: hypothetical protein EOP83_10020 [Verrucomicrobiaceae bacterium]|nr:MAG: hypothetical protein EOP83_10020 [Verrucomicrobiaceae bacterium]